MTMFTLLVAIMTTVIHISNISMSTLRVAIISIITTTIIIIITKMNHLEILQIILQTIGRIATQNLISAKLTQTTHMTRTASTITIITAITTTIKRP